MSSLGFVADLDLRGCNISRSVRNKLIGEMKIMKLPVSTYINSVAQLMIGYALRKIVVLTS